MTLRLRDVQIPLGVSEKELPRRAAEELGIPLGDLRHVRVVRRSVDARRKPRIFLVFTLEFEAADEAGLLTKASKHPRLEPAPSPPAFDIVPIHADRRVLVVGMGPAGLFAALRLAAYGFSVILSERGRPVEERVKDVDRFWRCGELDPRSNVQFGEGGAGTFSDGKLTTRISHPLAGWVLDTFVRFGAPPEIRIESKPHIGTDRLRRLLVNFRRELQERGVEIRFRTELTGLVTRRDRVVAGEVDDEEQIPCDYLVLAPGHSARDTYRMLVDAGVRVEPKPFAVGFRVEHPVEMINNIQYGMRHHPQLWPADYALRHTDDATGRGVYSFCMCPGGEVINASSEKDGLVVNGMSRMARNGTFSNSALVVAVTPADFESTEPLAGVHVQRRYEKAAFQAGGGDHFAPAQNLMTFLDRRQRGFRTTFRPGAREADLDGLLPRFAIDSLRRALPRFDRQMPGFVTGEAVLIGVETRTSAPVRILRDDAGESVSTPGLFPAGEGAGYAGGIMSAALDGCRVADSLARQVLEQRRVK